MAKKIDIDICKGVAILLVILGHSFIVFPINLHEIPWCYYTGNWIGSFHMPVFFLISGYLFSLSTKKGYRSLVSSRFKRIMIPYFSIGAVNLAVKLCFPSVINKQVESTFVYVKNCFIGGGYALVPLCVVYNICHLGINTTQG